MALYLLYLESGPQHKKTMVHVLALPGCIANGPTTEEALKRTPEAIRTYLHFLKRHGEAVDPDEEVQTQIAEHITEGSWVGNGDPELVFQPDLRPLTSEELEMHIRRLEWSREDMVALVADLSEEQLTEKPEKGRSIRSILEHVFGAEYSYLRALGKLEGVKGPGAIERMSKESLLEWMSHVRTSEIDLLRSLSERERTEPLTHTKRPRTLSRIMRRTLEHEWEHFMEIKERLDVIR